jgi:uncharacterized Zn-finger protein
MLRKNVVLKFVIPAACLLMTYNNFSQNIHHQMISAQNTSRVTNTGFLIKQTIGQTSAVGNFSGKFSVQQGFQQSKWSTYLAPSKEEVVKSYPNPFTQFIQLQLTDLNTTQISVQIFDINGKLVYTRTHTAKNNLFKIALSHLAIGVYLVKIKNGQMNLFTKVIKN